MWTVLDKGGCSNAEERTALMRRYLALFGTGSIRLLLADHCPAGHVNMPERGEFIGLKWLNFLDSNGIPFAIRVKAGMNVRTEDDRNLSLRSLLAKCRGARKFRATLPSQGEVAALTLTFAAKRIKGGELLIVASNVADQNTLNAYRRRWSIECLFGPSRQHALHAPAGQWIPKPAV